MRRIGLAVVLTLSLFIAPLAIEAQHAGKVWRLGVLVFGSRDNSGSSRLLSKALREIGYVEGQNLMIEWRFADGDAGRLPELAADLVRSNIDIIVGIGMSGIQAARQATTVVPIVGHNLIDPVANGLVASLARPGGNLTGTASQPPEFGSKHVQLLKEAAPKLTRLAVIWDPLYPGFKPFYEHAEIAARTLGITIQSIEVRQPRDIDVAFARITKERFDGLLIWPTNVISVNIKRFLDFALQNRLPTIYPTRLFIDRGGLMSYSPNLEEKFRMTASYIDRILKGAKPADLPVAQPTKYDLVINLKEARAIGLTIPQTLLLQATQVVE